MVIDDVKTYLKSIHKTDESQNMPENNKIAKKKNQKNKNKNASVNKPNNKGRARNQLISLN